MNTILYSSVLLAVFLGTAAAADRFEFLGVADGKILLIPIKSTSGTDDLTYQEAITKCTASGYKIATIETPSQDAIVQKEMRATGRWSWIDGVDFQVPNVYFSINTGRNLTFFNWVRGRPSLGGTKSNCIRYSFNSLDDAKMWDVSCTDKYSVICEVTI